jgi:hypothetical protein
LQKGSRMSSELIGQILQTIESEVRSRSSTMEYEMAYQARIAIDRIRFAIKQTEQFAIISIRRAKQVFNYLTHWIAWRRRIVIFRVASTAGGPRGMSGKTIDGHNRSCR